MTVNRQRPRRGRLPGWLRPGIAGLAAARKRLVRYLRPGMAGLAAAALAAAPACGDDGADDAGTDPTTTDAPPESTSTTAPPTPADEAEAVYLEFVEVVERLLTVDPDPDDPDLARVAVDPVLADIRDGTKTQQAENHLWQLGDRTSHTIGEITAAEDQVVLRDCLVENDVLVDQDDGRVVESTPLATRDLEVTLVRNDNGWAVSDVATTRTYEGETTCD